MEDGLLLVAAYWRTNLTTRQLAPLFGVSKSAAHRIIDQLGPLPTLQPRRRFANDTVLIVDGSQSRRGEPDFDFVRRTCALAARLGYQPEASR
ncbi:hypothetical protein SGFS_004290 [Streptomyces graminofaciens]|uniref:Transposase Helix-turn-helix domain-containing protein n=1 Tax=Streptomyces graminofaciens TaxID=68212 RepID=A0ABN5V783_9ACTN|nr:hypothetical protein SGFS_004290 [Streptomyces graminofaciens]